MVADVYKTSRFYRACRLLANWRRTLTEKSKREREKEKEKEREKRRKVSTRPLIPLWDAIIVRERMPRSEKQQPRRTTGSEGALIKLKNIVAALYPHACSSTQRIQKREKTDRRAEKPGHLRTYVRETRKKITWRERVYEREKEREGAI